MLAVVIENVAKAIFMSVCNQCQHEKTVSDNALNKSSSDIVFSISHAKEMFTQPQN